MCLVVRAVPPGKGYYSGEDLRRSAIVVLIDYMGACAEARGEGGLPHGGGTGRVPPPVRMPTWVNTVRGACYSK